VQSNRFCIAHWIAEPLAGGNTINGGLTNAVSDNDKNHPEEVQTAPTAASTSSLSSSGSNKVLSPNVIIRSIRKSSILASAAMSDSASGLRNLTSSSSGSSLSNYAQSASSPFEEAVSSRLISKQGYMKMILPGKKDKWKRFYFVLRQNNLLIYKKDPVSDEPIEDTKNTPRLTTTSLLLHRMPRL